MGGMSTAVYGLTALQSGLQTYSSVTSAQYNAASLRAQAKAIRSQSDLQAYLIREQYKNEYRDLMNQQEQQMSANRVAQAKYGITGASATAIMESYAAKNQKNLDTLYYNAAMKTGQQSLQAASQRQAVLEKARQYDWKAGMEVAAGAVNLTTGMLNVHTRQLSGTTTASPYSNLESGTPDQGVVMAALREMGYKWEVGSREYEQSYGIALGYTE